MFVCSGQDCWKGTCHIERHVWPISLACVTESNCGRSNNGTAITCKMAGGGGEIGDD